jgi:peptidoglycan/xylan/chitin deacetylase (PgdA/CDA1 family)
MLRAATYLTALGALAAAIQGAPPWLLALLALAVCGWIAIGMMFPVSGIFARPFLRGAAGRGLIALTFDDGPDPATTRRILDLLDGAGQRATFFLIGARAQAHPELVAEIVRRGHAVANHSFAHAAATPLWTTARTAADILRAQAAIARAAGVEARWYRPPIGLFGPRIESATRRAGLRLCGWSLRGNDGAPPIWRYDAARICARVARRLRDGDVVLLHDRRLGAEALPTLLALLAQRGLRSVTLDELADLGDSPQP